MRILVAIDQWFPDRQAGSARLAAASAAGLAARGHDVTVLAPRNGSVGESKEAGVVVRRVLARNALPQTLTDPVETWRHARELPAEGFDVLLAHESTTAFGLKGRAKRTPLVLMFHASAAREQRFLRSQLRPGLRKLSTYALGSLSSATSAVPCSSMTTAWTAIASAPCPASSTPSDSPPATGRQPRAAASGSTWTGPSCSR
jgi:hypothetical protein